MPTNYGNNFLKSFFTSSEFDFINNMNSDIEFSSQMLEKQEKDRDIIVNLINGLNDAIYFKGLNNESDEREQKVLQDSKNVFDLVNDNINALQSYSELSNSVKKETVDLLIEIDSEGKNISQEKYASKISNLKDRIANVISDLENIRSKVKNNNTSIDNFFNDDSIKEYLKSFSLGVNTNYESNNANDLSSTEDNSSNIEVSDESFKNTPVEFVENSNLLLVSEKSKKVYLPYSKEEVLEYLKQYPEQYTSFDDVVKKEFIFPSDLYLKHPVVARFREAYSLIRDREAKSVLDAFKFAMEVMFNYDLNPVIIAACKSQEQLEHYLKCLEEKDLTKFNDFEIKFEVTPLKA